MATRERLYACEPIYLLDWLNRRELAREPEWQKALSQFASIPAPGSLESVNQIYSEENDTAVIRIEGPLSLSGPDPVDLLYGYGGTSYATIINAVNRARSSARIHAVRFEANTPGGDVNGADITYQAIMELADEKPTECRVSCLLASAGYYILSPVKKILASSPTDEIGSIGVVVAGYDVSGALTEAGVKHWAIVSENAPKKAAGFDTKAGRDVLKERVDALERIFYARVSRARSVSREVIAERFGQGGVLVAQDPDPEKPDALRSGMIDGLSATVPLSQFIDRAAPHAASSISPANAGTTKEIHMTFSEFLAQGPAAAAEIEHVKNEARSAGRVEAQAEYDRIRGRIGALIASPTYAKNAVVQSKAAACLKGELSLDAFEGIVASADMLTAQATDRAAAADQAGQGETHASPPASEDQELQALADGVAQNWKKAGK